MATNQMTFRSTELVVFFSSKFATTHAAMANSGARKAMKMPTEPTILNGAGAGMMTGRKFLSVNEHAQDLNGGV